MAAGTVAAQKAVMVLMAEVEPMAQTGRSGVTGTGTAAVAAQMA